MAKKYLALLIFIGFLFNSCGTESSNEIKIDGSSTVFPITEAVAEEYRSQAPNIRVTVGFSGTGGGFQKFIRGDTDINNASREIQSGEIEKAKENEIDYLKLSVAYDGLAVVVNPQNDWVDYFTLEELEKIWEPSAQGEIMQWNDIREEWPEQNLELFGPGVASGTFDYFTDVIVGESGSSRGDFTASEDDNVLVQGVSSDVGALGFFGLAYYEENKSQLRLVPVENEKGKAVEPTMQSISDDTYSPLSRPLFIYVRKEAAQKQHVQEFINYYLNNAAELAKDIGYIPMPDSVYQAQKDKFQDFLIEADTTSTEQN